MAGTAVPKKKGQTTKQEQIERQARRDAVTGQFTHGGTKPATSGIVKGQFQQARADHLLEQVNKLQQDIDSKQGDPMKYLQKAISTLAPLEVILQAVGITKQTRSDWQREIEEGTSPRIPYLLTFFDALERQRADAIIDVLDKLKEIGYDNGRSWYSLCWLLERTNQDMFVVKREREARPQTNVQVNVDISARDALSQAEVAAVSYRQQKQIESGT